MIINKQDILEDIKSRIYKIQSEIDSWKGKAPADLKAKLALQIEAYNFNEWLIWRKSNVCPFETKKKKKLKD